MLYIVGAKTHYLERKPYMLYIMGVETPTLVREKTLHVVRRECEDTHII